MVEKLMQPPLLIDQPNLAGYQTIIVSTLSLDRTNDPVMENLFGGLTRPDRSNNQGATAESIPVVRDKATESKKDVGRCSPIKGVQWTGK